MYGCVSMTRPSIEDGRTESGREWMSWLATLAGSVCVAQADERGPRCADHQRRRRTGQIQNASLQRLCAVLDLNGREETKPGWQMSRCWPRVKCFFAPANLPAIASKVAKTAYLGTWTLCRSSCLPYLRIYCVGRKEVREMHGPRGLGSCGPCAGAILAPKFPRFIVGASRQRPRASASQPNCRASDGCRPVAHLSTKTPLMDLR